MTEIHECIEHFKTEKIDYCSGEGFNRRHGINPMMLKLFFTGNDGIEQYFDNWQQVKVNYCPFCGLKDSKLNML